ncbi:MAG TPA: phosphate ABC transporter substrate-binding protein PstS [Thermoleophilaceae bacterium]|jgi:phosphate transport system substrate-binding protein
MRKLLALAAVGVLALGVAACGSDDNNSSGSSSASVASGGGSLNGAGATFPQPVYDEWGARFKDKTGTTVNYQGIGSGGGVAQFTAGTVDFGASDAAMTDDEIKAASKKGDPVHVPSVFGAVTVSYNLDGVEKGLKLDGPTVANIFLGKVKKWDDPSIKGQNSGVNLPGDSITVCHRSDESGTTKLFTTFLADYSPAWKNGPGVDKTVKWPTGTGAKGNDGVAACVKQNKGAVGYVEQAYALQNNFTTADLKNKSGNYIAPSLESTSAAGVGLKIPSDLRFDAINAPGAKAYPIASATFLLVYKDMCKAGLKSAQAQRVKNWLDYAEGDGQKVAPELQYAPLPEDIHTQALAKVKGLTCNGKALK